MTAIIDIINDGFTYGYECNDNDLLYDDKNILYDKEFTPTTKNNNPIRLSVDRRIYLPCHRSKCK